MGEDLPPIEEASGEETTPEKPQPEGGSSFVTRLLSRQPEVAEPSDARLDPDLYYKSLERFKAVYGGVLDDDQLEVLYFVRRISRFGSDLCNDLLEYCSDMGVAVTDAQVRTGIPESEAVDVRGSEGNKPSEEENLIYIREFLSHNTEKFSLFAMKLVGAGGISLMIKEDVDLNSPIDVLGVGFTQEPFNRFITAVNSIQFHLSTLKSEYRKRLIAESEALVANRNSTLQGKLISTLLGVNLWNVDAEGIDKIVNELLISKQIKEIEKMRMRTSLNEGKFDILELDADMSLIIASLKSILVEREALRGNDMEAK